MLFIIGVGFIVGRVYCFLYLIVGVCLLLCQIHCWGRIHFLASDIVFHFWDGFIVVSGSLLDRFHCWAEVFVGARSLLGLVHCWVRFHCCAGVIVVLVNCWCGLIVVSLSLLDPVSLLGCGHCVVSLLGRVQ